jgi:hypothetical protein
MNMPNTSKNIGGKAVNLKYLRKNVKGKAIATARTTMMFSINALLGLLFQKGTILVLIANITSVCVNKDSINQAV